MEQVLVLVTAVTAVAGAVTAIIAARTEVLKYRREVQLSPAGQGAGAVRVTRPRSIPLGTVLRNRWFQIGFAVVIVGAAVYLWQWAATNDAGGQSASTTTTPSVTSTTASLEVEAADGPPGLGWVVTLRGRVTNPPKDRELWLVRSIYPPDVPRETFYAQERIELRPDGTFEIYDVKIGEHYDTTAERRFLLVAADKEAVKHFREDRAHVGDVSWDINRIRWHPGAKKIAPPLTVKRTR